MTLVEQCCEIVQRMHIPDPQDFASLKVRSAARARALYAANAARDDVASLGADAVGKTWVMHCAAQDPDGAWDPADPVCVRWYRRGLRAALAARVAP